ncbi:hypothetical protein MRX96_026367 [Rhipicephalus microplus]
MKNLRHIFLVVQIVGVLASHPLDHRSLPAVEIPFCGSTSAYVDVICAATDSSCVFESAAPSLLNSATACPFHEPRSTTSVTSSRLIVDGLKAHATCHPASGHGCTDRMKNLRHIFLVVQIVGVLASHPLDHRSLPAVEIPFCGSTSAYVDVICAATDSSCVFESAAPSLLNSATACPFHEPRSTTSVTSSRLIVDGLKAHATCHPASGHGCTDRMKNLRHIFLVVQIVGVLASHPLDHRSLPAVEIPFCGSTSAYVDVICAATDSSCVFESAAPSLLNSATACPFHEPRSTTSVTSSRLIVDGLKAHATCHPASGHGCTDRMKNLRHIFLVVQIVGVLASHPLDHRSLPAVEIPFCGSTSAYVDVICAATDSSCVFESAAPSLLNSATACPFHEPRSTTSVTSSRLIVDGLKAHATCHPASGHGCTDRMKNLRHIFLVVQIVGVLASHPLDHRSLPAVEIPFCGSTSAYVDVICAATDSSCVFESAAPSLLNSATACPFHEPRSTTNPTSLPWTTVAKQWPYSVSSSVGLVDTHCHLDFLFRKTRHHGTFSEFRRKHQATFPLNYEGCVAVFCDPETFKKRSVWRGLLAEKGIWGAFGCHPHMAKLFDEDIEDAMIDALEQPKVVALGEIGLDYSSKNPTSLPWTTLPSSGLTRCPHRWASSTPTATWTSCSEKPGTTARFPSSGGSTRPRSPLNYEGCVAVFCDPETFKKRSVWRGLLAEKGVWGAFGCHPHMAKLYDEGHRGRDDRCAGAAEGGRAWRDRSGLLFQQPLRPQTPAARLPPPATVGKQRKLPLVIHSRDASQDTLRILKEEMPAYWPIHRHCFTGGWTEAQQWMDTFPNLFLGLTPLVGFHSAGPLAEVGRRIPLDRLLLETDAPYFLPKSESNRLKESHPGIAIHVATQVSAMRDIPLEEVLVAVRQNTRRMYRI